MMDRPDNVSSEPGVFMSTLLNRARFNDFFQENRPEKEPHYMSLTIPFENMDPLAVLELNGNPSGTRFYWERPDQELALAAGDSVTIIKNSGIERFASTSRQVKRLLSSVKSLSDIGHSMAGAHLLGGFSFFDQSLSGSWSPFGGASLILPEWLLVRDGKFSLLTITRKWQPDDELHQMQEWFSDWIHSFTLRLKERINNSEILDDVHGKTPDYPITESDNDRKRWITNVDIAKNAIRHGHFKKIVLARELRLQVPNAISSTKLIHFLRNEYPACYSFFFQLNGEAAFIGSTPEQLLSLHNRNLKTEALAGSISRGITATRDTILANKLLESKKNQEEHAYVLDSLKEKLQPITNSLDHPDIPFIKKYANVQHLCTPVVAFLNESPDIINLVSRLHPTPAVGGYPEFLALDYIQEMEQLERGWYAGPIGWFNENNRAEFSVAIRSALIRNKHVRIFAGCGIVENSDPETEWEETRIKLLPMQKGLGYALQ